jgi:hypothetical protein
LKRSLSSAYIMANGDTCPQGVTYQKPVTEASLGGAILDIGYSIAQILCECKHAGGSVTHTGQAP